MISRISFRAKISISMIGILLLFGVFLAVVVSRMASQALIEESKRRGVSSALYVSARIAEPLLAMDYLRMKDVVDEVMRTGEDIEFVFIQGRTGKPLVHTFTGGFPVDLAGANQVGIQEPYRIELLTTGKELIYDFAAPVIIGSNQLGTVRLGFSHRRIGEALDRLLFAIVLAVGLSIVVAAFVGTMLARTVTRRISLLQRSAEEIVKGNLDIQTLPAPRTQCWEFMGCRERTCPAYMDYSHRCWYVSGTMCPSCVEGEYAKKVESCRSCPVYRRNSGDEIQHLADYFDHMATALRDRLEDLERTQKNLREQQQLFRTILDVNPDLLSLYDPDLHCRAANKAFCRFYGKSEDEVRGLAHADLLPEEQAQKDRQEDIEVIEAGMPFQAEKRMHGAGGERWFHVVKTPVFDADGRVIGLLCNGRDITEFKKLQERIVQAQKLESLGQLAAGVAHELNTPLGIILGYTQLMLQDFDPGSEVHETLEIMEKHSRICKKIVADLLRFSRRTETEMKPLSLNHLAEQVLDIVEHTFGLDRIAVERRLASDLPMIVGDQEKLQQVLLNLLNNARDAIGKDGRITLATGHDADRGEAFVSIADNGSGIPPEIVGRIFDPFFTTKAVGKGTGLGLAVTFGIVKDHGGQIDVESRVRSTGEDLDASGSSSEEEPGTVFTVRFPVCPAAQ